MNKFLATSTVVALCLPGFSANDVHAQAAGTAARGAGTYVCDVAYEDCRAPVLNLIRNETVGIDVSFWFMTDSRYSNEIVKRWKAGVPVRVIMDPRANTSKPANATQLTQLRDAGIPMLNKPFGDIAHWKGMIFAGQNVAEFSGANYSPYEYVFEIPYVQYQDESIYFSNEPDVVQSLMRRFDDVWVNSVYTFYANPVSRVRSYPTSYTIAPEFNLPPDHSYTDRLLPLLNAETQGIDVVMFRITDARPADALIRAVARGVPVRLYAEPLEYRNPNRLEDSYNIDRMYMGGVHVRMRAHAGQNHQKTVRLIGQHTTVFGTSNWSTASDDNQLEVNYFTTKDWFYQFFADQFEWKWNNRLPDGSSSAQTTEFVPLAPNVPVYGAPAVSLDSVTLSWYAGSWARKYDLYLGVGSNPPLYRADAQLGPSQSTSDYKSITVTGLLPGTSYAFKVVSKTMANVGAAGPLSRFTTSGAPPQNPPPSPPDTTAPAAVVYSPANRATVSGTTQMYASSWDNVAVAGVQFKVDGVNLGAEDRSAPFTVSWDTTLATSGAYTLTAQARDSAGNVATSAPVTVTVSNGAPPPPPPPDTTPPTVSLTSPSSGSTVGGATTLSAIASDDFAVAGVQFKLDGVNLGGEDTTVPYSLSWDTTSASNGTHTLTAQARDAAGNMTTSDGVSVTVSNAAPPPPPPPDTTPPAVAVSAPTDGSTVSGTTTISAESSDDVAVAGVQFKLDGVNIGGEDTTAPYSLSWDTTSAGNGTHMLTAQARDGAGNTTTSGAVSVSVSNTATPPPGTIVLRAADVPAANVFGNWVRSSDSTAADNVALWNTDNGAPKTVPAQVAPQHYVDIIFDAQAGTAYHLWIRMRAQNDYYGNDSIHVQFSGAVDAAGRAIYRIGSSAADNSAQVVLQERDGGTIAGWGWADQGWNGLGTQIYFATSGPHTIRIQQREDGAMFDQIVLSPTTFLTTPPGLQNRDTTIVPR